MPGAWQCVWRSIVWEALVPQDCTICTGLFLWHHQLQLDICTACTRSDLRLTHCVFALAEPQLQHGSICAGKCLL